MSNDPGQRPEPPPMLVKPWQFPTPHLRVPWNAEPPADLLELPDDQAAVASREILLLRNDLALGRAPKFVAASLEAMYSRVVSWRQDRAAETHHLDPDATDPDRFHAAMDPADLDCVTRYGATLPPAADGSLAARASTAIDAIARRRRAIAAPDSQVPISEFEICNRVALAEGNSYAGNRIVYGDEQMWRYAPGAKARRPTRDDPYDPRFARTVVVVPAAPEVQDQLHRAALQQLAELVTDPQPVSVGRRFSNAAYLLYQAPQYREGSDDIIRTFLAAIAHLLFTGPLVMPQDLDAQAQIRSQADLPDLPGFVTWFAQQLPPALARRQRNRRLGPQAEADSPPMDPSDDGKREGPKAPGRRRKQQPPTPTTTGPASRGQTGSAQADLAMMAQLMYAMYVAQQALQNMDPETEHEVEEVIESWF